MLQVAEIREHKEKMIAALAKRGIDATQVLEEVIKTDELRRNTQAKLDETLAQSNTFSKEIGMLFKNGETQKAGFLKLPKFHDGSYYRKLEAYFTANKTPIKDAEQKRNKFIDKPLSNSENIKSKLIEALKKM